MMRLVLINSMMLAAAIPSVGCHGAAKSIPASSTRQLKAKFDLGSTTILEDRYIVIEIIPDDKSKNDLFPSGSFSISSSAWHRMNVRRSLNLKIVDLQERKTQTVFDRQVALGDWKLSLRNETPIRPRFKNKLILPARTEDTTGDNRIDWNDAMSIFAYDLVTGDLRRLSPTGYHTQRYHFVGDRLILAVEKKEKRGEVFIYESDPVGGEGSFVVQGLTP